MMHPTTEAFLCPKMELIEERGLGLSDFASLVAHTLPKLGAQWELSSLF